MAFENILVICVGNICRSPMAEALLRQQFPDKNIESAGVGALVGYPADQNAIALMAKHGMDISSHKAKQINSDLALNTDLIFTMSDAQTKWIETRWPYCRGKTFKLGYWSDFDIADPYQRDTRAFETAYKHISIGIQQWEDKIA